MRPSRSGLPPVVSTAQLPFVSTQVLDLVLIQPSSLFEGGDDFLLVRRIVAALSCPLGGRPAAEARS